MSPNFHGHRLKMHYVEQGEGTPIVFLHGLSMDHTTFVAQFEELPETHRCIALDLRGHGHSEFVVGTWTINDLVLDAIEFIEGIGVAPCHFVGHSLGGIIGLHIALDREEILRSLVLIDSSADAPSPQAVEGLTATMEAADQYGITDAIVEGMGSLAFGAAYREANPDGIASHADRLRHMERDAFVESLRAYIHTDSVLDRLSQVRVPTLVIHGEADAVQPMAEAEKIVSGIAGAELVRIPEAGHTPPIESPDVVNDALARFFARLDQD